MTDKYIASSPEPTTDNVETEELIRDASAWEDLQYGWCLYCHPEDSNVQKHNQDLLCDNCGTLYIKSF